MTTGNEGHLTDAQLAAYLDDGLEPSSRRAAEEHLAACEACAGELASAVRALGGLRRRRGLPWLPLGALAVAALLLVVLVPRSAPTPGLDDPRLRAPGGSGAAGAAEITLRGPEPDERLPRPLSLRWAPLSQEVAYRVVLTDPVGDVVWTETTEDTALVLPASLSLQVGQPYFWYVDALLPGGAAAGSEVRSFVVEP